MLRELEDDGLILRHKGRRIGAVDRLPPVAVLEVAYVDDDGDALCRPVAEDESAAAAELTIRLVQGRGRAPGINASVNKLVTCELNHDLARAAIEVMGSDGWLDKHDPRVVDGAGWPRDFMFALGLIIGGGTAQIQKNIISERGLGMPREPKPAKS